MNRSSRISPTVRITVEIAMAHEAAESGGSVVSTENRSTSPSPNPSHLEANVAINLRSRGDNAGPADTEGSLAKAGSPELAAAYRQMSTAVGKNGESNHFFWGHADVSP